MDQVTCSKCKQLCNVGDFYKDTRRQSGIKSQCKACHKSTITMRPVTEEYRLYQKAYYQKRKTNNYQKLREQAQRALAKMPKDQRFIARRALYDARRRGKIVKPSDCQACGLVAQVHGHHEDYNKPYDVEWLCRYCHTLRHRDRRYCHETAKVVRKDLAVKVSK